MKMSRKIWAFSLKTWEKNLYGSYRYGNHQHPGDMGSLRSGWHPPESVQIDEEECVQMNRNPRPANISRKAQEADETWAERKKENPKSMLQKPEQNILRRKICPLYSEN